MTSKPYEFGITLGRFQMLHKGHIQMLNKAASLCDTFGVIVGSSQETGTEKNPFPYEMRKEMLLEVLEPNVKIIPLPDAGIGNVSGWGEYVFDNVLENFGRFPDLVVSGKEDRRAEWFQGANGGRVSELFVPKFIDISGTQMREFLLNGNEEQWRRYTDERLWRRYGELKKLVEAARGNKETASI